MIITSTDEIRVNCNVKNEEKFLHWYYKQTNVLFEVIKDLYGIGYEKQSSNKYIVVLHFKKKHYD